MSKITSSLCSVRQRILRFIGVVLALSLSLLTPIPGQLTSSEVTSEQFPSQELINEILQVPGRFADQEEETDCKRMVEALTDEETEQAARTSYAYWVETVIFDQCTSEEVKVRMAMREARRHYVGHGRDFDVALYHFNNTVHWRKANHIDLIRAVWITDLDQYTKFTEDDKVKIRQFREWIAEDLIKQTAVIRGHDRYNRPIAIKYSRSIRADEKDLDSFRAAQLFMAEKAIATVEIRTKGREEKVVSVFEFSKYNIANLPPASVGRSSTKLLQDHYPERASKMMVVDAPVWSRMVYKIVAPFLSKTNRELVMMIAGDEHKKKVFRPVIDIEQAMPFILPDGKLSSTVDALKGLNQPFHFLYDD